MNGLAEGLDKGQFSLWQGLQILLISGQAARHLHPPTINSQLRRTYCVVVLVCLAKNPSSPIKCAGTFVMLHSHRRGPKSA